jgi:hypothetical protein
MAVLATAGDVRTRLGQLNTGDTVLVMHPSNGAGGYDTSLVVPAPAKTPRRAIRARVAKVIPHGRLIFVYLDPASLPPSVLRSPVGVPLTVESTSVTRAVRFHGDPHPDRKITRGEREHEYRARMANLLRNSLNSLAELATATGRTPAEIAQAVGGVSAEVVQQWIDCQARPTADVARRLRVWLIDLRHRLNQDRRCSPARDQQLGMLNVALQTPDERAQWVSHRDEIRRRQASARL